MRSDLIRTLSPNLRFFLAGKMDNLITPHCGTATEATVLAMTRAALDNIWGAIHDEEMIAEI